MSEPQGFIDLRVGHGAGGIGDDSVWPSFTDIMTVIVMIFLMVLVVIMVRNFELDRELLSTTMARDATTQENQDLVSRLIQIEAALSDIKIEKDTVQADLTVALKRLSALLLEQQSLTTNIENVIGEREQLQQANLALEQQQQDARSEIRALTKSEQALSQQLETLIVQLSTLKQKSSAQIADLTDDKQSLRETLDSISVQIAETRQSLQQSQSKNVQLTQDVAELKTSHQIASAQIADLTDDKQSLRETLDAISAQLAETRQSLQQAQSKNVQLTQDVAELKTSHQIASTQIADLTDDKQSLRETLDAISAQLAETRQSLQQSQSKNVQLTQDATELKTSRQIASEEVLALMALIKQRVAENAALQVQATTSAQQFKSLQQEYETLDAKYRDLIRPARSTAGKQVAIVWIEKFAGRLQYKMTQPNQPEPQVVEEPQMHRALQALKEKFGNQLYIKVVIPKGSDILYEEAAGATQEILQKYDYYSQ